MEEARKLFTRFVPEGAVEYCAQQWYDLNFKLMIKKKRLTKLGDYRYNPKTKEHVITLNNDLNPYAFLITYLHEVAHLVTYKEYKNRVNPHGTEWKAAFRKMLLPVLSNQIFPEDVLHALKKHITNIKASSCSDPHLLKVLNRYDRVKGTLLSELKPGMTFKLGKRIFKKHETRRTRVVCSEVRSGRKYLISKMADVVPLASD